MQISNKRFCVQGNNLSLYCSGHQFKPEGLQAGGNFSCFIKPNENRLYCWGPEREADKLRLTSIPQVFDADTQGVALGSDHICGIDGLGSLQCWGNNDRRQCEVPAPLRGAGTVAQADAGAEQTCAVSLAGELLCWGSNNYGQTNVPQQ